MLHAVIMAGGSGTRFWPASRHSRPKQLLTLATDSPLLRMTFERLGDLVPVDRVWVVTTAETTEATRELLPELAPGNILSEPTGRNTAACAGLAAHAAQKVDPDAVCIVLPADHVIGEETRFRAAMAATSSSAPSTRARESGHFISYGNSSKNRMSSAPAPTLKRGGTCGMPASSPGERKPYWMRFDARFPTSRAVSIASERPSEPLNPTLSCPRSTRPFPRPRHRQRCSRTGAGD